MGFLSRLKDWMNKNTTGESIRVLQKQIEQLSEECIKVNEERERLMRIMKYTDFTSDQPTFHLGSKRLNNCYISSYQRRKNMLCIYLDRDGYVIDLKELRYEPHSCQLSTTNDPGLLLFECCVDVIPINYTQHKFIIDYKQGHYVHSQEDTRKEGVTYEKDK